MKKVSIAIALSVMCCTLPVNCRAASDLSDLGKVTLTDFAWLAGKWRSKAKNGTFEEQWMTPCAEVMPGMGREVRGDDLRFFEYLRLEKRTDGIFYVAQPFGKTPTDFKLMKASQSVFVFANPQHDFPKQIEYRRNKNGSVTVCGTGDEKSKKHNFELVLYKER